jgi:transposase-like protein
LVSDRRDAHAARKFFARALGHGSPPVEVTTDRAPVYPRVIDEVFLPRGTRSSNTRTTAWKLTMPDSRLGCGRCAG